MIIVAIVGGAVGGAVILIIVIVCCRIQNKKKGALTCLYAMFLEHAQACHVHHVAKSWWAIKLIGSWNRTRMYIIKLPIDG